MGRLKRLPDRGVPVNPFSWIPYTRIISSPKVFPKITFSPSSNPSKGYDSEIIIRDGNGYYYFFGGGIDYVDYTDTSARDAGNTDWPITSWKLKKIVAPSGRSVNFIYGTQQLFVFRQYSFDTALSFPDFG